MFNSKIKKHVLAAGLAGFALAASQSASAFLLVPNGDFESGGDNWGFEFGGGGTVAYPVSGGNGGGYQQFDNTSAGWGAVSISTDDPAGALLSVFGVSAGGTYDFTWDQLCESGGCGGMGIKVESWGETGVISDSGDQIYANSGSGWESQSFTYTIEPTATRLKVVMLGLNTDSVFGFDNVGIVGAVPVPAAVWLFG